MFNILRIHKDFLIQGGQWAYGDVYIERQMLWDRRGFCYQENLSDAEPLKLQNSLGS